MMNTLFDGKPEFRPTVYSHRFRPFFSLWSKHVQLNEVQENRQ